MQLRAREKQKHKSSAKANCLSLMKSDDTWLMAYVDGELPLHEREEVERELRTSPDVAERVALLQASRLPYRDAFAGQKLPPVPASLTAKIDEMARAAKLKAESQ